MFGSTFLAFCRVDIDGKKWMMFQRRTDYTDFYRNWTSYANGFGTVSSDNATGTSFWLGLKLLNQITSSGGSWQLRVDLQEQYTSTTRYAVYSDFTIGSPGASYPLRVSGYSGTAGDSLSFHSGSPFSTYDADHDASGSNCAVTFKGAWWYVACHASNLNGILYPPVGCYVNYADGTDWCGSSGLRTWSGFPISCPCTDSQPCHHTSLKVWMLVAPSP